MLLSNVLAQRPVATIDAAIAVMSDIEQTLPATDGLWWFNHLYLRVTVAVFQAVAQQHEFRDPEFLHRLDMLVWPDLIIIGGGVSKDGEKFIPHFTVRPEVAIVPYRSASSSPVD